MPSDITTQYVKEMLDQLHYFATWEPGTPLQIGEIGVLDDAEFRHIAYLKDKGFEFDVIEGSKVTDPLSYSSKGTTKVDLKASGAISIPGLKALKPADAGIVVNFKKGKSIAFEALGIKHQIIRDIDALEKNIINSGIWEKDWVYISDLICADSATVLISLEKNASIELKANASVPNISLANIDANLEVASNDSVQASCIAKRNCTPLFHGRKLTHGIFDRDGKWVAAKALVSPEFVEFNLTDFKIT